MNKAIVLLVLAGCSPTLEGLSPDAGILADAELPYECTGEDTHSNSVSWPVDRVIEVIDATGNPNFFVEEAVNDWNALGIPVTLVYERRPQDETAGQILVKADPGGAGIWLGYAETHTDGAPGEITSGKVSLSPSLLGYSEVAAKHIVCQELGHTLGLTHIVATTCMDDCTTVYGPERTACINDVNKSTPGEIDRCQLTEN